MRKRGRDRLTSGVWLRALDAGDEVARDLLGEAVEALGVGIGSAVTLLDVEAVVLGGGLGERLGPALARPDRARRPRAHVLPRPARVPARRARRPRRRDRREPARPMRAVLVTGAARGLGAADRRATRGRRASRSSARTSRAPTSALDVRDPAAWDAAARALEAAGEPWALVNCAARTIVRDLFEIEPEEWDDVLATNLRGPFLGIRAIGPLLAARGGGRIVNVSSDSAFKGRGVVGAHYAASKAAVISLTRRAAAKLAPSGVTVNAVVPGTIDGETVRELAGDQLDALAAEAALGRLARAAGDRRRSSPGSCPDEASYVTGSVLVADGGASL